MTKLRIVLRHWLGRPYVVEEAQCVALLPKKSAAEAHFGPYVQVGTFPSEDEARNYCKNRMNEKVIAQFHYG